MRDIDFDKEREYENSKVLDDAVRAEQSKFYWATELCTVEHDNRVMRLIQDKRVLEIGCSMGEDATQYSKVVASYIGCDISDKAIEEANKLRLHNCEFICTDGHSLPSDESIFDVVIVNSLLHHMDLKEVFEEIRRVLVPGGKLAFREPLGTNPLFGLYRFITPNARTPDERPFNFADIKLFKEYFEISSVSWFGFLNLCSAFVQSRLLRAVTCRIDQFLSKTPLKFIFWQFAGIATVKK